MANVKLGCIPYQNRPDRSPVEGAGRGLSHFHRPSAAAAANCRTANCRTRGGIVVVVFIRGCSSPLTNGCYSETAEGVGLPVTDGKGRSPSPSSTGVGRRRPPPLTKATAAGPPTAEPSGPFPSSAPAVPGPMMGSISTNRAKDRADAQRLVTTRLLDRLHDPLGHFSRLQRIYPRAR